MNWNPSPPRFRCPCGNEQHFERGQGPTGLCATCLVDAENWADEVWANPELAVKRGCPRHVRDWVLDV